MSNLLTVQNNNNELGIGTTHIGIGTHFDFIDSNKKSLLRLNYNTNEIELTTATGIWEGSIITPEFGGTGLSTIGTNEQVLAVKNDESGLIWRDSTGGGGGGGGTSDFTSNNLISTQSAQNITIGNINQELTINASKLLINTTQDIASDNNMLGYQTNKGLVYISESEGSSFGSADDLFKLMDLFYPGYDLLLMSLDVKTTSNGTNLLTDFSSTKFNYILNVKNTIDDNTLSNDLYIEPTVYNNASIRITHDITGNSLNNQSYTNNLNPFTINDTITNFDFKIGLDNNNPKTYTLQIIRKVITITIAAYGSESDRTNNNNSITTNNFRSLTQGSDLFIKFTVSETNTDFQENDITITNGTILNFNNSGGGIYTCLLRANTPTTGFTLCEIKVIEAKCKDNEGNLNSTSNVFNFKYDNIRPTMAITAFKSINDRTLNQNSIGAGNYNQSDINPENELFIKMISSELTNNFTINDITEAGGTLSDFVGVATTNYSCKFTLNSGNPTICSLEVPVNSFVDLATNSNNNPSNIFTINYDTVAPTLIPVTAISTPSNDTTPSFVFTTSESGTLTTNITEGFSTSSSVTTGSNQTVTFKTLPFGTYSGKTITVTDLAGNASSLSIPEFTIEDNIWTSTFGLTGSNIPSNNKRTIKIKLVSANRYLDVGSQNFGPNYVAGTQWGHYEFMAYETSYNNHFFTIKYDDSDSEYPWKIFWDGVGENTTAYLVSYIISNGFSDTNQFSNNIDYTNSLNINGNNERSKLKIEKQDNKYSIKTKAGFYIETTILEYSGASYGGYRIQKSDVPRYIWDIEFP